MSMMHTVERALSSNVEKEGYRGFRLQTLASLVDGEATCSGQLFNTQSTDV
jgi:hypothetical protein